ncbi:DNA/RNA non-specific endonuclease [Burkholderia anthina]|uniref:DNA/RNA non-specific endonuclease n=1 Tax=Burkholderia anthina TaxID=179879 RepID=UPI0024456908|nr:DNA/RNA non-specific endonuclease [Burkholderia anthina]
MVCSPIVSRGAAGQPLRATATITAAGLGTGTTTNASSRAWARLLGYPTDDAGHIPGKLLGGSGGKDGVFPQLPGINRGLFRDFEGRVAAYVNRAGSADVDIQFVYGNGGTRPTQIIYDVFQYGKNYG